MDPLNDIAIPLSIPDPGRTMVVDGPAFPAIESMTIPRTMLDVQFLFTDTHGLSGGQCFVCVSHGFKHLDKLLEHGVLLLEPPHFIAGIRQETFPILGVSHDRNH